MIKKLIELTNTLDRIKKLFKQLDKFFQDYKITEIHDVKWLNGLERLLEATERNTKALLDKKTYEEEANKYKNPETRISMIMKLIESIFSSFRNKRKGERRC